MSAQDLNEGDVVRLANGENTSVLSVETIWHDDSVKVYNFEVEDFHTYYVSRYSVLVHNTCFEKPSGNPKHIDDAYLKRNGVDPHSFKKDVLGGGSNSAVDIYVDTKSGEIWLQTKKGLWSNTGENWSYYTGE